MTEFSTNNDINNKSHLSQPLQNSPRHINKYQQHQNSPQHFIQPFKQIHLNNKNNQATLLPLKNSSANINNINNAAATTATATTSSSPTSVTHSPIRYKNPLNSPNNSPFAYAYGYGNSNSGGGVAADQQQHHQQNHKSRAAQISALQHLQLQQQLRNHKLSHLTSQTQYQQHLNDLLLQQQHLQKQQQKLLSTKNADNDDELSEESLKQNVAIVLNNLDRYNNALRSIILNEQVSNNSSSSNNSSVCVFDDDSLLLLNSNSNNNFMLSSNAMAAAAAITPESDYNSNATTPGSRSNMLPLDSNASLQQQQQHLVGFGNATGGGVGGGGIGFGNFGNNVASSNLNCSFASSHDFSHDNSDYQWFLDYGYRDGCSGMQRSVLSSLSASYNGIGDLIYYEDLAKNMDANLAEADMESFRTEDIHSLLSHLPSYCKSLGSNNRLQQSLILHQQQQQQQQLHMLPAITSHGHHNISQTSTTSTNELIDNSICKSELLFSPVKESHISVDSLDMDAYPDDGDIILTCQANKDNYTIAFEGSVLYSDESFYAEPNEIVLMNKHNFINLHSNLEDIVKRKSLEVSMSRSEQAFTARTSKKTQKGNATQLQRYPSGNNNTSDAAPFAGHTSYCIVRKSSSLPNLDIETQEDAIPQNNLEEQLNVSQTAESNTTIDSYQSRNLLPMCQMPISCSSTSVSISERLATQCQTQQEKHHHHQQQQQHEQQQLQLQQQHRHKHRCCCNNASAAANSHNNVCAVAGMQQKHAHAHISGSASSGNSNPPAFNLVKLFIKQKSSNSSSENQANSQTCMDVSSGCWPSSDAAGSSSNSSSSLEQRMRKKSMNDSGKGSALSRHDEEDMLRQPEDEAEGVTFKLDNDENVEYSMPKRHLRACTDAVFYDDEHSSSSAGSLTATNSPAHRRRSMPLRNPQLCQLATKHHNADSLQSSDGSRSNSEQLTQVYMSSGSAGVPARKTTRHVESNRTVSSSDTVTRSMQTSCGTLSARSSISDRFRCVPPSFLAKLNNLGDERQAPIYVIYPSYALPDLGFVTTHSSSADVIFSPFNYKTAVNSGSNTSASNGSLKNRLNLNGNDDEILKTMDYKHVVDWQSLATLLPVEYRRRLKHIPEVSRNIDSELSQRPLFCMTPPIRGNKPTICDCAHFFQQQQQQQTTTQSNVPQGAEEGSSSSGSSQQPSSGYRGSSTLLTDSELDTAADPLKQMYVYQYEQQRMDSGIETSPAQVAERRTPPHPMPRGILRKTVSQSARVKRNSMIENQQTKLSKLEKRRSLQEPVYNEQFYEVFEEEAELYASPPQPRKERLSRKDLDARARAENFLSSLPRSELKYYAEIAAILESSEHQVQYDAAALKKEVSRALSQQKKVSFNDAEEQFVAQQHQILNVDARLQRFSTPPNSPNISMASVSGLRTNGVRSAPRRCTSVEEKDQRKIESNRFKRLQIQWELMSKDSSMLKELANAQHTKSGGSTPTSATAHKSRIPRPVSYPAGKRTETPKTELKIIERSLTPKPTCVSPQIARITSKDGSGKTARSPSRIVPPKRYSMTPSPAMVTPPSVKATTPTNVGGGMTTPTTSRARTPTNRNAVTAPNTPSKRRVQSPRTPRVR